VAHKVIFPRRQKQKALAIKNRPILKEGAADFFSIMEQVWITGQPFQGAPKPFLSN
jgi:hypothetical protein